MSEPITLWDADGRMVTLNSPSEAARLVQAGELHNVAPVTVTVVSVAPVDVVPMSKRIGRPRKGDGVL